MNNSPKKKEEALCDYLQSEYFENPPEPLSVLLDEEIPPPDADFLKRVDHEIRYCAGKKMHLPTKHFRSIMATAVVILLALSVTAVSQNWTIYNFLVSYGKHGVSVSNGQSENEKTVYVDYSGSYVPSYIPVGYSSSKRIDGNGIISLEWQTDNGEIIRLDQYQIKNQLDMSKESDDTSELVLIQGQEGILIQETQKAKLTLMWGRNPQFVLSGSIPPDEAIKMADSISYCE